MKYIALTRYELWFYGVADVRLIQADPYGFFCARPGYGPTRRTFKISN